MTSLATKNRDFLNRPFGCGSYDRWFASVGILFLLVSLALAGCGRPLDQDQITSSRLAIKSGQKASAAVSESTVALVHASVDSVSDKERDQAFCSGTVIADQLVLTAAHCVIDKDPRSLIVRFADGSSLPVSEIKTYKTEQKYGVNFDVAWLRLEGSLPNGIIPAAILRETEILKAETKVTIAGYGQTSTVCAPLDKRCLSGNLFEAQSQITEFLDRGRWFHLLLTRSEGRQGPCLGDSGGPLFITVKGRSYLAGSFVGWDKRLVAEQSSTLCDKGEGIYSWAGAYVTWIEKTSGVRLAEVKEQSRPDKEEATNVVEPQTFREWCESRDEADPAWYTVQRLVSLAGDYAGEKGGSLRQAFEDCAYAEQNLREKIKAEGGLDLYAFAPQSFGDAARITDLRPLKSMEDFGISRLTLKGHAIDDFRPLDSLRRLNKIEISENAPANNRINYPLDLTFHTALETLILNEAPGVLRYDTIRSAKGLRNLEIRADAISALVPWGSLALRTLRLEAVTLLEGSDALLSINIPKAQNITILSPLRIALPRTMTALQTLQLKSVQAETLPLSMGKLRTLSVEDSQFQNSVSMPLRFEVLSSIEAIQLTGNRGIEEIYLPTALAKLRSLELKDNELLKVGDLTDLPKLTILDLANNRLSELPLLSGVRKLNRVFCQDNRIDDPTELSGLEALQELDLSRNPIQDLSPLNHLVSLKQLKMEMLDEGRLSDLSALSDLPNLLELRVASNSFPSVKDFLRFSKLEVLVLSNNLISDISNLANLKTLEYLEVVGNPLLTRACPLRNPQFCRFEWISAAGE